MSYSKIEIRRRLNYVWIILFIISSYLFYNYVGFSKQLTKALYFGILPITILFVSSVLLKTHRGTLYINLLKGIFLLMLLSMLMAFLFWDQSFALSYRSSTPYLAICFFFLLIKLKPSIDDLEKVIWLLCILYIILWLYGLSVAPQIVFGLDREEGIADDRGIYRLFIPGKGVVILAFFMALNKYTETRRLKWILIFSTLFIVIVLHVIRQVILFAFLVALYQYLRKNKYAWIWISFAGLALFNLTTFVEFDNKSVIGNLIALSEDQAKSNQTEENIRIQEYRYFFSKYSKNMVTDLFGNGVPHSESTFGRMDARLAKIKYFFPSDVGYAEIFIRFGIAGLLLYSLIFYRVLKQKVPSKYEYAKLYLIYLIFANIAASWVFHDTIIICLSLYILERCHSFQSQSIKQKSVKKFMANN